MKYRLQQASNWHDGVSIDVIDLLKKNGFTVEHSRKIHKWKTNKYDWEKLKDINVRIKYYTHCCISINTLEEFNDFCTILQNNNLGSIIVYPTYLLIYDDYIE